MKYVLNKNEVALFLAAKIISQGSACPWETDGTKSTERSFTSVKTPIPCCRLLHLLLNIGKILTILFLLSQSKGWEPKGEIMF